MIIVQGKKTTEINRGELVQRITPYTGVAIDIGTGDGRFAAAYARAHPDWYVIGLDPVADTMAKQAGRARRKRTRIENALFVMASVEQMPVELENLCDRTFINLPWGSLMRGLMLGGSEILSNLARIAKPGATLRAILNLRIFDDPVPIEVHDLPEIDADYVEQHLQPAYATFGFTITEARMTRPEELLELSTTWAKRLSHRKPPPSVLIEAVRTEIDM